MLQFLQFRTTSIFFSELTRLYGGTFWSSRLPRGKASVFSCWMPFRQQHLQEDLVLQSTLYKILLRICAHLTLFRERILIPSFQICTYLKTLGKETPGSSGLCAGISKTLDIEILGRYQLCKEKPGKPGIKLLRPEEDPPQARVHYFTFQKIPTLEI